MKTDLCIDPLPEACLAPTAIIDCDHPAVAGIAAKTAGQAGNDLVSQAVSLYYFVRDTIWYDPYTPFYLPEHYRASSVLARGRGFCIPKAALLCALGRASGIPSRLGFATVKNHLATRQLIEFLGCDLFAYHGFVEFYLEGRWVKATPAFNLELCRRHDVPPLEFNGREDSIFQPLNLQKKRFMEYVEDHGSYNDVPLAAIVSAWKRIYGEERIARWIKNYERFGDLRRDFYREEVIQ
jgi:transglutaminase-like putative cysteine protease